MNTLAHISKSFSDTETMPVIFAGHGSPMNAIEDNVFSKAWRSLGESLPKPSAILCISAHWETKGTMVTAMKKPRTIHDFGGFPQKLYQVEYPVSGSPELGNKVKNQISKTQIGLDQYWGLDHGCWSVLIHMFPKADIPVVQLSLDYTQNAQYHYDLSKELVSLRKKGVLIVGSGNIVHNLRMVDFSMQGKGFDWAMEANEKMKTCITKNDHHALINYQSQGKAFDLSIPTPEHYLPLLYILALKHENEAITFFNDQLNYGGLSMTSMVVG